MGPTHIPDRGDLVWLSWDPQAGHEQMYRRPAAVLSPLAYNQRTGLAVFCPVTSQVKGYPFEVAVPSGFPVSGVILADQAKSLDWVARRAEFICTLPDPTIRETLGKLMALLV